MNMAAEDVWPLRYRPGEFASPHIDYYNVHPVYGPTTVQGLFFLTSTELGGNLVLPLLGIAVNPEPGSLVLWYDMDLNGNHDPR